MVIGVTWDDPDGMATLQRVSWKQPQSRLVPQCCMMWYGGLYKNGDIVSSCPPLRVSTGDDVSIKHTSKQLHFYKNKQLHYTWDIETPAPVWGYVALDYVNKISVKGQTFYHFIFVILNSYVCKCK